MSPAAIVFVSAYSLICLALPSLLIGMFFYTRDEVKKPSHGDACAAVDQKQLKARPF